MDDRHVDGDVPRPAHRAADELAAELGVVGEARHEGIVEDSKPSALEDPPAGRHRQRRQFVIALGRAQQVALAEQLGAVAPLDADATHQQPIEHEQADADTAARAAVERRRDPPAPGGQKHLPRDAIGDRLRATLGGTASASAGSSSSTRSRSEEVVVGGADIVGGRETGSGTGKPDFLRLSYRLPRFAAAQREIAAMGANAYGVGAFAEALSVR